MSHGGDPVPALLQQLVQSMLPALPPTAPAKEADLRAQRVAYLSSLARRMLAGGPRSHVHGTEHSMVQQAKKESQSQVASRKHGC